ncbi:MAG TPA: hypothetical protein VNM69_18025 [Bacillus sp. (in: firmicutes)]|nr:hypothetical protein [Bacillus sp. (in: firmicutes)]
MKKFLCVLLITVLAIGILPVGNLEFAKANEVEETETQIQDVVTSEWKEEDAQEPEILELMEDNDAVLLHNNGKPIETDIVSEGGEDFNLFAIHKTEENGSEYETYYFENREVADLSELKETAENEQEAIEINESEDTEVEESEENNIFSSISTFFETPKVQAAVKSHPKGGYYRTHNWTFYGGIGNKMKMGTYSTVHHLNRKSSNANINGKNGSIWDVKAENTWKPTGAPARLENLTTRMEMPYKNQLLLSYGPKKKSNGSVTVTLEQILTPMQWSFTIKQFGFSDSSSIPSKYGRWTYTRESGYPNPFVTKPGIRASNTSGNFALQVSHTLNIDYKKHSTGIVTISVPDR